ncbi:MAG: glucose 1-dehydrogenase [Elainellaceae cyanobacterium]
MAAPKTILITGGAQGIGKGICQQFLQQGWNVAIADRDREAGDDCLQEFKPFQSQLQFVKTDVAEEASVQSCVQQVVERFQQLDVLVNNAGIANPYNDPIEQLSLDDWQRVIQTNITGYFLMAKHTIPHLRSTKGAIVNIASTRALQSEPHSEAYAASKGGIVAFTHALAISLGPEIRVNCISPGWIEVTEWQKSSQRKSPELRAIDHQQHPAGRVGTPADVSALVEYLVSDAAAFVTGQNLILDGGMTRKMIYEE